MANEFLTKMKEFKSKYKEVHKIENELTDDDIIALLDKHLQVEITPEEKELPDEEPKEDDHRSINDEVPENDEIEQFSESQLKLLGKIEKKIDDLNKSISKIKRKTPPVGDISDKATTIEQKIKANWFEVDV